MTVGDADVEVMPMQNASATEVVRVLTALYQGQAQQDPGVQPLKLVADDARFIRLLNRGTQLRENLIARWRAGGSYVGAREIVSGALLAEHFSASTRAWTGINVMTIHKSKGKEFDEVIIFEGSRTGRLLRDNANARDLEQARLTLRVAVTRARKRTTVLTPSWASCTLLF